MLMPWECAAAAAEAAAEAAVEVVVAVGNSRRAAEVEGRRCVAGAGETRDKGRGKREKKGRRT